MPNLKFNAPWWSPNIQTTGFNFDNPSTTAKTLIAAVAGQHIILTGFSHGGDDTTGTLFDGFELYWGAAANWSAASAADKILYQTYTPMGNAAVRALGAICMGQFTPPIIGPVNTKLVARTDNNISGAGRTAASYYMVDSTTLRPV